MTATMALVAASDFASEHFLRSAKAGIFDSVVAVDGGFRSLESVGYMPTVALGDFDSLGYVPDVRECLTYPTHKDASDLELALGYAKEQGATELYVYGALGGRLDHTIANLQLLARFAESGMDVTVVDPECLGVYLVGPTKLDLPADATGTISVFSMVHVSKGVTEKGLLYPMEDALLTDRTSWGLSNEFTGQLSSISIEEGTLLVLMENPQL